MMTLLMLIHFRLFEIGVVLIKLKSTLYHAQYLAGYLKICTKCIVVVLCEVSLFSELHRK